MPTFQCAQCGWCCNNIRVEDTLLEDEFLEEIPGYFVIPSDRVGLNLFGWEKKILETKAEELNIKLTIEPFKVVFDERRNLSIVISWSMVEDPCPFFGLKDKLCPIHEVRPLVCQYFPVLPTCFSEDCPEVILEDFDKIMTNREKMLELYGDQYLAMMAFIKTHIQLTELLKDLRDEGIIYPMRAHNPTHVEDLMNKYLTLDIFDFLVEFEETGISKSAMDDFIELYSDPKRLARNGHI